MQKAGGLERGNERVVLNRVRLLALLIVELQAELSLKQGRWKVSRGAQFGVFERAKVYLCGLEVRRVEDPDLRKVSSMKSTPPLSGDDLRRAETSDARSLAELVPSVSASEPRPG